jgi:hypothetical protein
MRLHGVVLNLLSLGITLPFYIYITNGSHIYIQNLSINYTKVKKYILSCIALQTTINCFICCSFNEAVINHRVQSVEL